MLTQNLVLDDASGDAINFNLQVYLTDGARRIDILTTPTEPRLLEIRHTVRGKGPDMADHHLVSSSISKADGAGTVRKGIVNLTFTQPRSTAISQNDMLDCLAAIVDLVTGGGFSDAGIASATETSAILRGES